MNTHDKYELPPLPELPSYESDAFQPPTEVVAVSIVKALMTSYARAAVEPYQAEIARMQRIIDSRPAINAGLPQTYIEWSHSIYQMEAARALEVKQ